ncbi:amidohydrolase family protein [Cohnella sp. AR92]|uniref:amidohydrolase family protein n=1 Tax=Cohnella sp. AR92 TaxID=648716 RepID=UPI000F8DC21B|nr:amidohydrolase family protein [Cohnella sp. AR92]RUS42460.1 amidohydrolase [Cohnella sp. AR92]
MKKNADELTILNARLPLHGDGELHTLRIAGGRWAAIEPQEGTERDSEGGVPIAGLGIDELGTVPRIDLQGRALLPGFVDAHMHLDKAYTVSRVRNVSGTLLEAIENYRSFAPSITKENIRERIVRAALSAASYGSLTLRSHLDVAFHLGRDIAMRTVEAALEAREQVKDFVDIQYFPMFYYDPERERELTEFAEETLRMGIDGVGGAPHLTPDPAANIDWAFRLAAKFDRPIDLHTDETDDPSMKTIDVYCDYALRHQYRGRATAGHLCSLSAMDQAEADRLIAKMAEAGIGAVTLPPVNLYLQGRGDRGNVRRGVTRVRELAAAGVPVAAASDNIQDPFHPFGRGDLLQIGLTTAYAAHLAKEEDIPVLLRMLTSVPALLTGANEYGIAANRPASFVVADAFSGEELFQELPATRWVYNKSRWIFASRLQRQWAQPLGTEPAVPIR